MIAKKNLIARAVKGHKCSLFTKVFAWQLVEISTVKHVTYLYRKIFSRARYSIEISMNRSQISIFTYLYPYIYISNIIAQNIDNCQKMYNFIRARDFLQIILFTILIMRVIYKLNTLDLSSIALNMVDRL